jgi:predicted nucleotide-binding protein
LNQGEKLAAAMGCANGLASLEYSDAAMLLKASGFSTPRNLEIAVSGDERESRSKGYMALLRYGSDDKLLELRKNLDKLGIAETHTKSRATIPAAVGQGDRIFIVHGHNHGILYQVVRILERVTDREVVILHEQPNTGRTIIEKFEDHAASAAFAVVLMTGDDEGRPLSGSGTYQVRARQNVIFEAGFFFGTLGRQRVVVLLDNGVEEPSDINGLVYISIDSAGAWKYGLMRELGTAGIDVDYQRLP